MKFKLVFLIPWLALSCTTQSSYLDPTLPVDKRVDLLMSQMTLEEKIAQMNLDYDVPVNNLNKKIVSDRVSDIKYKENEKEELRQQWIADVKNGRMGVTRNIHDRKTANEFQAYAEHSRLKIPLFIVENYVHGVGHDGHTIFPSYISMGSSFHPELVRQSGAVTAREGRLRGINWTFAPTIDISRDARWGRMGETWGEDTYLASIMGVAMVKGLQFDNEQRFRMVSCLKHFIAGGQALNGLNFAPVDLSERTLREYHLPPFKAAIEAGAASIMVGHNEVMGVPCHCSKHLISDILRKELRYEGVLISDWLDMERLITLHKVSATYEDAITRSINVGLDVHNHGKLFCETVKQMVEEGKISRQRIDQAARAILKLKFEYGLFENRYVSDNDVKGQICTEADKQLALQLARESIVLLKNSDAVLPIKKGQRVLLTGTNADNYAILGDWITDTSYSQVIKIKDGFIQEKPEGIALDCYTYTAKKYVVDKQYMDETVRRAAKSDVVVLVLGGSHFRPDKENITGGENYDMQNIELFGNQMELLKRVKATGKPVVTVLVGGRNLAFEEADTYCDALIQAWEPGMMGGKALAEIVYGKISPSGKLSMSMPRTNGQVHVWYNRSPSSYFRNFVSGNMGPLYEFGQGLSYTTFKYSNLRCNPAITKGESQKVSVEVSNTGQMTADEVVLCYLNDKVSSVVTPVKKLVGFKRITLHPSETRTVHFDILPDQMALYDENMQRIVEEGEFEIFVDSEHITYNLK